MNFKLIIINLITVVSLIVPLSTCSGISGEDANLSSLTISEGTLTPSFDKETLTYSVKLPITTYSVTFTATAVAGINALITINTLPAISGQESGAIVLYPGANAVEIKVKSSNREKEKIYTVNVTKSISDLEAILQGSDTGNSDKFGWSLACDGTTLVVGAPGASSGSGPGAVYIFNKGSSGWVQSQKLTASGGSNGDNFGWSVALYENTIAVGAKWKSYDGTDTRSGGVYIFTKSGTTWSQQGGVIEAPTPCKDHYFGTSVSLSGSTLAVGEPNSVEPGLICSHAGGGYYGAVYIYTTNGSSWSYKKTITASDYAQNNYFGEAVSLDSGTIAIGARGYSSNRGSVYIFTGSSTSWTEQIKIQAAIPIIGSNFGSSLSLSGTRLLIGAPTDSILETNSGAVYLFSGSGSSWQQSGDAIRAATPVANQYLGNSINLSGDMFVVGISGPPSPTYQKGSAVVYAKQQFYVWGSVGDPLEPTGTEASLARFGQSIATTDTEIFVGADNYDLDGSGAVYIYH